LYVLLAKLNDNVDSVAADGRDVGLAGGADELPAKKEERPTRIPPVEVGAAVPWAPSLSVPVEGSTTTRGTPPEDNVPLLAAWLAVGDRVSEASLAGPALTGVVVGCTSLEDAITIPVEATFKVAPDEMV